MEVYKKLYEKEVTEKLLDYDKLLIKYINLLYLFILNVNHNCYHNINYLKNVIIGFNYYQKQYIGEIKIPSDCSLRLFNLWTNIISNNNDNLNNLEALLLITTNIISYLKNIDLLNYEHVSQSLIFNLFNVYATLENQNHLILN